MLENHGAFQPKTFKKDMPDIAKERAAQLPGAIDWVGMAEIEVPIQIRTKTNTITVPARVDAYVSLDDPEAKGIHMSRPFLLVQDLLSTQELSLELIENMLREFVTSQKGISKSSHVRIRFDYMSRRPALKSDNSGWRTYPVELTAQNIAGRFSFGLQTEILYSSTCPCSAALARQLIQEKFTQDFKDDYLRNDEVLKWLGSEQGIIATPHSQRSRATVKIALNSGSTMALEELIDRLEQAIATPVQTSVKREDEQEFARLNGQNLMFVEDASRILRDALDEVEDYVDFHIHVEHLESLHAHDAVATIVKGVPNGFKA